MCLCDKCIDRRDKQSKTFETEGKPMKRWSRSHKGRVEVPAIDKFLEEIEKVCKNHNLSISHEDLQGSFTIEEYDSHNIKWLFHATDNR